MAKLTLPKFNIKKRINEFKRDVKKQVESDAAELLKQELETVVQPFSYAKFNFTIEDNSDEDSIKLEVLPVDEDLSRADKPERGTVNSRILFKVLNEGNEGPMAFRVYPDEFENETSPDSLQTSSKDYDRDLIFVDSSKPGKDIEARNWTELIREKHEQNMVRRTEKVVRTAAQKIFR